MVRSRGFCYTLNNHPDDIGDKLERIKCRYHIWQEERGHNGTRHIQAFIYFDSVKNYNAVLRVLPRGIHLERMMAPTPRIAAAYCRKEDTRVENGISGETGTLPVQGDRVDLGAMKALIDIGGDLDALWEHHFAGMVRYGAAMRTYMARKDKNRTVFTQARVFWGATDTGKSHAAHTAATIIDPAWVTIGVLETGKFWMTESDTGRAPKCVVLEDFTGEIPYRILIQMLDKWPCTLPVKHGHAKFNAKFLFITSNLAPEDWYALPSHCETWEESPLYRRLTSGGSYIQKFENVYRAAQPFAPWINPMEPYPAGMFDEPPVHENIERFAPNAGV